MSKPFAWSYSALGAFETCPHRYMTTRITKEVKEPQTEATLWGNRVHKAFEENVKMNRPFPNGMEDYAKVADTLKAYGKGKKIDAEQKLAINRNMNKTEYFASDVWLRSIIDVTIEADGHVFVGDYKTGKKNPDSGQLRLTAAIIFATRPWIENVTNSFLWLKDGTTTTEKFVRQDASEIWQEFMPRVKRMEESIRLGEFPKRPSGLCRNWCPVHTCEHNGKYGGKQ